MKDVIPNTKMLKITIIKSVAKRPIEVSILKCFFIMSGGMVVPPLEELLRYKMATPTPKSALPNIIEMKRFEIIIVSGTIAKDIGKRILPSNMFAKALRSRAK